MTTSLKRMSVLACALALGGCADYLGRKDAVTARAGDASAFNTAVHAVEPFPAAAERTSITSDGVRAATALERFRTPPVVEDEGGYAEPAR